MYTVLVIDDDKSTLNILEPQLRPYDYRIITEISPIKGVELAKEFTPDVILLDLNMPLMNGFEVMRILRKDKLTKEIPIVIFTIDKDKETVINALRSGAIDYIVKPYNPYQLGWKIKSAIQYGISKKLQNQDEFIEVSHKGEIFVITMRGEIRETGFQNALKKIFNAFFMKQIHGKICIFDIKEIKDFSDADVSEFIRILSMFYDAQIKIVTGKHYGEIVSCSDIDQKVELFLSFGDLDHAMNI